MEAGVPEHWAITGGVCAEGMFQRRVIFKDNYI
jgi:hypothetical protein